jgi:hypothetical protein
MTIAAVSHVASHGAASKVVPSGGSDDEQYILLLLVLCSVIVFIQHDASGKPQDGNQFAAIGVVGFLLLVLSQFIPELALTFTILFTVAIILNSPKGVPLISSATSASVGSGGSSGPTATGSVTVNPNTGTAYIPGLPTRAN